jgi:hypothetical protein
MIQRVFEESRTVKTENISSDLVVVGGGMAGTCCALTAARAGINVILVQDRPVLGGNASSEVRLWILGDTSHMGNNNRWAREGGIIDEILVENTYRNKEGNPVIFDTILLEKVREESNITLLLNTMVYEVHKTISNRVDGVTAFCSQNSTKYHLEAPLFCDASGDGIVAFQAGAPFRMGAEKPEEFDEGFAPNVEDYGELLGHSIYFYTKDAGKPVNFVPPKYALSDVDKLPRLKNYKIDDQGCRLWWVEYGGRMNTVHDSETIKWELWKVIYGIWNYVKNSGEYPESKNLTLEWVGTIPGKRESRRFEGDYMLHQKDVIEQRQHYDDVAFGGWALDLHPADGVYSEQNSCTQWHSKGIYTIPYRCYYSKGIDNLFLVGRIASTSHVAFGSARVMATCSHGAQAVGMAAALATENGLKPRDIAEKDNIKMLQKELNKRGQSIPHTHLQDKENLVNNATIEASDELILNHLPFDGPWVRLDNAAAQLLPMKEGIEYSLKFWVQADGDTTLEVELRTSSKQTNYTPDITIDKQQFNLQKGEQEVEINFSSSLDRDQYAFICFPENENISIKCSKKRVSGLVSVFNKNNPAVSNFGKQQPPQDIGIEEFEFWTPERRPAGHNLGFRIEPALPQFGTKNINNGFTRPTYQPNAWAATWEQKRPELRLEWDQPQNIRHITLMFDTDFDHAMESALMGHAEAVMPFVVRNYTILDDSGNTIYEKKDNYQTINNIELDEVVETSTLKIEAERPSDNIGASIFEVLCY